MERKYEDLLGENKKLKEELGGRIGEIIEFYGEKEPREKEGKVFGELVRVQHQKREELLAEENSIVTAKFKELEIKSKQLAEELRQKTAQQQTDSKRAKQLEETNRNLTEEINNLKGLYSDQQIKLKQVENKESLLIKAASRTSFQISELNKEIEELTLSVNKLRAEKGYRGSGSTLDFKGSYQ